MYACFISYCHGQHDLVKTFIEQFKEALKNELDALMDEEVYVDKERLLPGYRYNEALARAICESVCMIVVYSPKYERHAYCLREFEAMRLIEDKRRAYLGLSYTHPSAMIIPVILRGTDDLPAPIKNNLHFCDFSKFTLADTDVSRNPEYLKDIAKIAKVIQNHHRAFEGRKAELFCECSIFQLPPEEEVRPWRPAAQQPRAPFPGRESQP